MCIPVIRSWIEERHQLIRQRVVSGDVAALEIIATSAGQAQILGRRSAAMLLRANVIRLVTQNGARLREPAILAAIACSLPHRLA
jgi:hypothetical protein